jgi:hypothetical protein
MTVSREPEGAVDERKAVEAPSAGAGEMEEEAPVGRCARAEEELLRGCRAAKTGDRRGGGAGCTRRRCGRAAVGKQCAAVVMADKSVDKGEPKGGDAERGAGRQRRGGVACGGMGRGGGAKHIWVGIGTARWRR